MKVSKEVEKKIMELQIMEQNLQNIISQKQSFQGQFLEVENAVNELKNTKDDVYKVIGSVMVKSSNEKLLKELEEKKEILELRIKNIDKQEKNIREKANEMQKDVMKAIEK